MSTPIPTFYRIFFTWVDPLMCIGGALGTLFAPTSILESYTPRITSPPALETSVLLDSTIGWFAGMAFLQAYLLRARPADLVLWRALQVAMIAVDVAMLGGLAKALGAGGFDTAGWRGGDWGNMVGYPALIAVRLAFLAGGVGTGRRSGITKAA